VLHLQYRKDESTYILYIMRQDLAAPIGGGVATVYQINFSSLVSPEPLTICMM
jgi:hypothetical protein